MVMIMKTNQGWIEEIMRENGIRDAEYFSILNIDNDTGLRETAHDIMLSLALTNKGSGVYIEKEINVKGAPLIGMFV